MWNDTDIPLAVLFTYRCYGTWLHGDARTSVDRHNNRYGSRRIPTIEHYESISAARMKHEAVHLDAARRKAVDTAIRETCIFRGWLLQAINVRTNHVHAVITIGSYSASRALAALKANATRSMRESGCWSGDHSPWAEKGSKRLLWNEKQVSTAVEYVILGQGDELPKFE